jgi:hypothetical protein
MTGSDPSARIFTAAVNIAEGVNMAEKKAATRTRSAKSGEFVKAAEAKKRPASTVTESVKAKAAAAVKEVKAAEALAELKEEAPAKSPEEMTQSELQLFRAAEEEARAKAREAEAKA